MIDYWVSFATSLDPNDGRGIARMLLYLSKYVISQLILELNLGPHWGQYTTYQQVM